MQGKKLLKISGKIIILLFFVLNIFSAIHAYKFTHFTAGKVERTKHPENLSAGEKLKVLFTGVSNPRPVDTIFPEMKFEHFHIKSNKTIDCWYMRTIHPKGTVILFHGYGSSKAALIGNAGIFYNLGYNTMLVDFMGSGESEGNQTTVGYKEAEEVKSSYDYLSGKGEHNIFLFGCSMGAASILKAMNDYHLDVKGIILECPFGSMYRTVCNRFRNMGVPEFPAASLLTFWGGIENGFWAYSYQPSEYAKSVKCPALLMYGAKDRNVGRDEIDEIYRNLAGEKYLKIFQNSGHESYLKKYPSWRDSVSSFMDSTKPNNSNRIPSNR
jgi:alpha-beta hydrolase superfamily lysophospholipase